MPAVRLSAMEISFDKLFNQILEAEQIAEKIRNDSLQEIENYKNCLREQKQKNALLQHRISEKSVQLQEETLQLKYCSIRCAALHKQKTQLQTSYDCCLNTLNKFKQQWRQEFTEFCMAVPPFIASYGLLSYNRGGAGGGEGLLKKELEKLSEEERFLKSNLKNYEENLAKLTKLSEQQQQLQNQLEQLGRTLEGVLEEEKVLADRVVKLTEEKQEVDCKPKTDPYFVGLHSETVTLHRDYDQLRKRYEEKVSQLKRMQQNHNRHRTKFQKT